MMIAFGFKFDIITPKQYTRNLYHTFDCNDLTYLFITSTTIVNQRLSDETDIPPTPKLAITRI